MGQEFRHLPVHLLQPGQYQPRQDFNAPSIEELAHSIKSQGLIEPLIVRGVTEQHYEIIAGERRWRAAKIAGLETVPCIIGDYTDQQACAVSLIENIQRQDLNLIEEATGYQRLINEFHFHQDEIASWIGKSRSHIANILRLLQLSPYVKETIQNKQLSFGHARALIGLDSHLQEQLARNVIKEDWSVRFLEKKVKELKQQPTAGKNPKRDKDIQRLQSVLSEQLGTPVLIEDNAAQNGGWLKLKYFDNDTLAGLLEQLGLRYDE